MMLGVDYHPEQWPDERWPEDARLMKEAGVSVVRLGHMAWSHIEADDNYYNLRWLNRVMDLLLKQGIKVVLAIPTGSPPPWLVQKFPDILPVDAEGRRLQPGTYNHRCFLSKHYHDYARNFTMRLTKEIWGHRAILGWQIDGKIGALRCYCETCHRAFLDWLRTRYKTVERLNADWGTVAWGHEYTDFIQIPLPWQNTGAARDLRANSPSLILDFWRFSADVVGEFVREQAIIIQRYTTRQSITLDCGEAWEGQDCFELAKALDFVSCGTFVRPEALPFRHDLFYGLKQKDFWVMEHPVGAFGWNALGPSPCPGEARMRAWQAIGHGASAVLFSPWRSSPSGTMQLAEGVLGHDGVPRRRYEEMKRMGAELDRTRPFLENAQPKHEVAILWDHEQQWALQIQRQTTGNGVDNEEIARWFHGALQRIGVGSELVGWKQDFAPYKLLLLPPQYMMDPERAEKLTQYVAAGGWAVFSTRTGIKNLRNVNYTEPAPATLRDLLGIEVIDADVLGDERSNLVRLTSGEEFAAIRWCDVLALKGAEACGHYAQQYYKETPAVTCRAHGKGRAYYVGAIMAEDFYRLFFARLAEERKLRTYKDLPAGVDLVARQKDGKEILFVTNQSSESRTVAIGRRAKNLLDGTVIESAIVVEGYGVAVVEVVG